MSLFWNLPKTYGHLKRLRQILLTLARHGFSHLLTKMPLTQNIPGVARLQVMLKRPEQAEVDLSPPERLRIAMEELGATFIKLGQILAVRPDLVPPEYITAFSKLQDQVEPVPFDQIRTILEARLEKSLEELFREIDPTPVASGSIGQVHFATLFDGTLVVVKVKRPGTDELVRKDLELLAGLAPLAEDAMEELRILRPRMLVEEFSRCMARELDFVGEASYTEQFSRDFEGSDLARAPKVYWEFVTRDTLVLERITGVQLSHPERLLTVSLDPRKVAQNLGFLFMRQFFVTGFFHADPHQGNIFVGQNHQIALIDFGQMGHLSEELRKKLALTVLALASGNTDVMVDLYADIGALSEETNLREFKTELASVIDRYYGVPVDRIDMGDAFQEAMSVARRHKIILPPDFVILSKSFVTIMGVIQTLDPNFKFDKVVSPFTREIVGNLLNPLTMGQGMGFYLYRLFNLLRRAPEDVRDLVEKAKSGHLRFIFHHEGLLPWADRMENAINRLTMGILIGAITVGSAIVLQASQQALGEFVLPYIGMEVPVAILFSGAGFGVAVLMGFYLAYSIFRSNQY